MFHKCSTSSDWFRNTLSKRQTKLRKRKILILRNTRKRTSWIKATLLWGEFPRCLLYQQFSTQKTNECISTPPSFFARVINTSVFIKIFFEIRFAAFVICLRAETWNLLQFDDKEASDSRKENFSSPYENLSCTYSEF